METDSPSPFRENVPGMFAACVIGGTISLIYLYFAFVTTVATMHTGRFDAFELGAVAPVVSAIAAVSSLPALTAALLAWLFVKRTGAVPMWAIPLIAVACHVMFVVQVEMVWAIFLAMNKGAVELFSAYLVVDSTMDKVVLGVVWLHYVVALSVAWELTHKHAAHHEASLDHLPHAAG